MSENKYLAAELAGIDKFGDYTTPSGDPAKVQALIDLIRPEATTAHRGLLDNMSPIAHRQLIVELTALKAAVS